MVQGCEIQSTKSMKKWEINPDSLDKLYPLLYKNIEIGGKFTFPITKDGIVKTITSSTKIHTMNGDSDSVQAPEGLANFHTHPVSCYVGEDTVWGWPSGEDIRETLLFGMKGSIVHLVIAIEGVYSLQVNPCVLSHFMNLEEDVREIMPKMRKIKKKVLYIINKFLKDFQKNKLDPTESKAFLRSKGIKSNNVLKDYMSTVKSEYTKWSKGGEAGDFLVDFMTDVFRGLIVLYIEIYCRASHRFRSHDVNLKNSLYPQDFVKYINKFKIANIFNHNKKVEGCGNLSCHGVPIYENKKSISTFNKYITNYENTTGFYMVSHHGETLSLTSTTHQLSPFNKFVDNIVLGTHCKGFKNTPWKKQWFHMIYTPNYIEWNNKQILYNSKKFSVNSKKEFLKYLDENKNEYNPEKGPIILNGTPIFYFYEIKGECDHLNITKYLSENKLERKKRRSKQKGKSKLKFIVYGSTKCGWCSRAISYIENKGYKVEKRYYKIDKAIELASKKAQTNSINSVPAIFVGNEYIGGYSSVKKFIKNIDK